MPTHNYSEGYSDFVSLSYFPKAFFDVLSDANLFYHQLNNEEKCCVDKHLETIWKNQSEKVPPLKLRNLVRVDYTYRNVDMRMFLPPAARFTLVGEVCASCFYYYRGRYRIFIRFRYPEAS